MTAKAPQPCPCTREQRPKGPFPGPPKPPNMRIGDRGETWDEQAKTRIPPPPTVEYRNTGSVPYRPLMLLMVAAVFSAGFIVGFLVRG